jgi:hypothetical protein
VHRVARVGDDLEVIELERGLRDGDLVGPENVPTKCSNLGLLKTNKVYAFCDENMSATHFSALHYLPDSK